MAADKDQYCGWCRCAFQDKVFSIQCDKCDYWYHGQCVNIREYQAEELDKYYCPECSQSAGPSVIKKFTNAHRNDRFESDAQDKPTQAGTPKFVETLKNKCFASALECTGVATRMRGQQLTLSQLSKTGFETPIFVDDKDGLDMVVPTPDTLSFDHILPLIDNDYVLDIIDVTRQLNIKMPLTEFISHIKSPPEKRTHVYNCISLEVSNYPLGRLVQPPSIVNKLSWVDNYWPKVDSKPAVARYCLMSMQNSYTDFHIDFGGTSVWYHVVKGEKVFYLAKPTPKNLEEYEKWMTDKNSSESFLGDQLEGCYKLVLGPGQTLFIPTGWIHAVLTTKDSLVFGGNFLHSLSIHLQLQIYQMEQRINTPEKFRFPYFELTHWYAAPNIKTLLSEYIMKFPPKYLVKGVETLIPFLKTWQQNQKNNPNALLAPQGVECKNLLGDLARVHKKAERRLNGETPVKKRKSLTQKTFNLESNEQSYLIAQIAETIDTKSDLAKQALEDTKVNTSQVRSGEETPTTRDAKQLDNRLGEREVSEQEEKSDFLPTAKRFKKKSPSNSNAEVSVRIKIPKVETEKSIDSN